MTRITAHFDSRDQAEAALGTLRRAGAGYSLSPASGAALSAHAARPGGTTLQVTVKPQDAALVRAVLRDAGDISGLF